VKTLYLIRHAKSSWSNPGLADFDRGLNKRGKRNAPFMGKRLADHGVLPDLILSSPAKRAKKTANKIAKEIGYPKGRIIFKKTLYHSSVSNLLKVVTSVEDNIDSLFVVGHNWGITEFAEMLTDKDLGNIPTSGIAAITFPLDQWQHISWGDGDLLFFDFPKKHGNSR